MKKNELKNLDLKSLDKDSLKKEINSLKKELFNLKLNAAAGETKDFSQFKKLRKKTAQCLTYLNQNAK